MSDRIGVTIIGGYLGSGKTTLVNHVLRNANGLRLAVLVNDFGALPIDADLIQAQDGDVISLSGGCVCCSYGDDLSSALINMQSVINQPDHIIIEASGVALPGAIGKSLTLHRAYQVDSIVVLADASTVMQQACERYIGDTITRQLSDADIVVLNKLDLIEAGQLNMVRHWLVGHCANASVVDARHSRLDVAVILQSVHVPTNVGGEAKRIEPKHDTSQFFTFRLDVEHQVDATRLAEQLAEEQTGLIRAKGFILDRDGQLKTIQVVGRRWSLSIAPKDVQPGLVCIGLRSVTPNVDVIRKRLAALSHSESCERVTLHEC